MYGMVEKLDNRQFLQNGEIYLSTGPVYDHNNIDNTFYRYSQLWNESMKEGMKDGRKEGIILFMLRKLIIIYRFVR